MNKRDPYKIIRVIIAIEKIKLTANMFEITRIKIPEETFPVSDAL